MVGAPSNEMQIPPSADVRLDKGQVAVWGRAWLEERMKHLDK